MTLFGQRPVELLGVNRIHDLEITEVPRGHDRSGRPGQPGLDQRAGLVLIDSGPWPAVRAALPSPCGLTSRLGVVAALSALAEELAFIRGSWTDY